MRDDGDSAKGLEKFSRLKASTQMNGVGTTVLCFAVSSSPSANMFILFWMWPGHEPGLTCCICLWQTGLENNLVRTRICG